MGQVVHQIITIVCSKCSRNLLSSLERRITYNRLKAFFPPNEHFRKLKRPVERSSPLQQLVNFLAHYLKILSELFPVCFGKFLASRILKRTYQHGVTDVDGTLKQFSAFGIA